MKSLARSLVPLLVAGAGLHGSVAAAEAPETIQYVPGEVQVRLGPGTPVADINEDYGTTCLDSLPPRFLLRIPEEQTEQEAIDALLADPRVQEAECSWTHETPEAVRQMIVIAVGGTIEDYLDQTLVERIHLSEIHEHFRGRGIRVAVLDTGVLASHEAFAGCIAAGGYDFVDEDDDPGEESDGIDGDGDGDIDEAAGHGTMVAGIVHLVAPDAEILPIRVLDDEGIGRTFDLAKGIQYALDHGADVINLSLGLLQHSFLVQDQILLAADQDVVLAGAAGNLAAENPPYYPAMDPQVLSVAALDSSDVKASFSNWHHSVDLSAPGVGVLAPYIDGAYAIGSGTSFAVPFVSGQCALILEGREDLALHEVQDLARAGTVDIYWIPENTPYEDCLGSGRVDGIATLHALEALSGVGDRSVRASGPSAAPNPARRCEAVRIVAGGESAECVLHVLDVRGRTIRRLAPSGRSGGFVWDGADGKGRQVPAGVYLLRMPAGSPCGGLSVSLIRIN